MCVYVQLYSSCVLFYLQKPTCIRQHLTVNGRKCLCVNINGIKQAGLQLKFSKEEINKALKQAPHLGLPSTSKIDKYFF